MLKTPVRDDHAQDREDAPPEFATGPRIDMIYQCTGQKTKAEHSREESLRKLAGGWSPKQGEEFLESIKAREQIDEETWK